MPTERKEEAAGKVLNSSSKSSKPSWTARFRRKSEEHQQQEKKRQLQDYTAWVNNYLKKRPSVPVVTDIRSNFQDGVTFVHLTEIVARVQLEGVDRHPATLFSRRVNLDRAVEFLLKDGVMFQGDPVKDILDGNSKGIMRVILAMAERYQPRSVKQRPGDTSRSGTRMSQVDMTRSLDQDRKGSQSPEGLMRSLNSSMNSNSCSVPNMVSLNVSSSGSGSRARDKEGAKSSGQKYAVNSVLPNPTPPPVLSRSPGYMPSNSTQRGSIQMDKPFHLPERPLSQHRKSSQLLDIDNDTYSTPVDTLLPSMGTRIIQSKKRAVIPPVGVPPPPHLLTGMHHAQEELRPRGMSSPVRMKPPAPDPWLDRDLSLVMAGLTEFKSELLQLHIMLLKNSGKKDSDLVAKKKAGKKLSKGPEGGGDGDEKEEDEEEGDEEDVEIDREDGTATPTEDRLSHPLEGAISTINALALEEKEREVTEKEQELAMLQDKLSHLQDEFTQTESECVTLRNMVEERDVFITTMKSEIYRKEYKSDTEKVELRNQLMLKDASIKKLEGVVKETADSQLAQYHDISSQLQEKEEVETALTAELSTLKEDVSRLTEVESALEGKLSTRERRIVHLEDKIADMQYELRSRRVDLTPEDVDNVHECLGQLRSSLAPQDQQQRLLDALEQMISDLIGRMMERTVSPSGKRRRQRDSEEHYRDRDRDRERDRDRDRDRGDRDRDRDRDKDRRRRHREKHGASHNGPSSGGGGDLGNPTTPTDKAPGVFNGEMTKVFCYMLSDKTETPYVTLVPSSLASKSGGITLRDFKTVFDRQGSFRFYFKTEDPDCGVVKEEITSDDQILPMWKGKIHVWVSEKGTSR